MRIAVLSFVLSGAMAAQQAPGPQNQAQEQQKCTVAGTVLNAATGEPIRKAHVEIVRDGSNRHSEEQGYGVDAGSDGSFRFDEIEPGSYTLSGEHAGFIRTELGAKSGVWGNGTKLTLKPGQQMNGVKLALTPQAVISGRVLDGDGDAVQNAAVQLEQRLWRNGKQQYRPVWGRETDDTGSFRISGIGPGKYFVVASLPNFGRPQLPSPRGKPDLRLVRTYYPEADGVESAAALQLTAGQELSGIDVRMRRATVHRIAGKVALPPGSNGRNISLNISRKGDFFFAPTAIGSDGAFDFVGLEPGDYTIRTFPGRGSNKFVINQTVQLGSSDIRGLVLTPLPPVTLTGHIRVEGQQANDPVDITSVGASIHPSDSDIMFGFGHANANQDGSFKLDDVDAGTYFVKVNTPDGTYVSSIRFRGQDVTGKAIDLTKSGSGDLEIAIQTGAAKVTGTVQQSDSTPAAEQAGGIPPSQTVLLIPDTLDDDGTGYYSSECDQSGAFTLKNVRPGHYMAVAVQQLSADLLGNPDLLRALAEKGTEEQVGENDKKQIQLTLMPDGDWQQAKTKAGVED